MSSRVIDNRDKRVWTFSRPTAGPLILVIVASLGIIGPALIFGVPSNIDLTNHFRFALPFYDALVHGEFYPSWLAESNSGYGDPSFRFYPPAFYYLLATSRFLIGNWYAATLLAYAAVSLAAGLGMFFWTKAILPASRATWASLFYGLAPYHVNQLYQATLLAEWAGSAILPFVFGFVERVCKNGRRRDVAGLAGTYALLVLTHLPLAVIGSLALFVYAVVRTERTNRIQTLIKLGAGATLGLCASAIYWVTMISELRWIGVNEVERDASVDYRFNFVLSTLSPDNLNVWWMNILLLTTVLLFAPALLLILKRQTVSRSVVAVTALALFMTLPISRPLWQALSVLQQTQFPWRWLSIVSMGGSILTAAALPLISDPKRKFDREKRILILGAMTVSVAFTFSHIVREAQYQTRPSFENTLNAARGSSSVNYWFPIWSHSNPRPMVSEVEAGDRVTSVASWQPEHRQFSVAAGTSTEARVRTFFYPHWIATSNGTALATRPDKDGALLISLPQQPVTINLDFREPPRARISALVSFCGFLLIGLLALPTTWRPKHEHRSNW